MPSKKKKYNSRFPPARIKKIMQTDEDIGKVAAAVPVLISKCLEMFLASLLTKAGEVTRSKRAKTMSRIHLRECIMTEQIFDFLKDHVAHIPDIQGEEEAAQGSSSFPMEYESPAKVVRKRSLPKPKKTPKKRPKLGQENESDEESENTEDQNENGSGNEANEDSLSSSGLVSPTVLRKLESQRSVPHEKEEAKAEAVPEKKSSIHIPLDVLMSDEGVSSSSLKIENPDNPSKSSSTETQEAERQTSSVVTTVESEFPADVHRQNSVTRKGVIVANESVRAQPVRSHSKSESTPAVTDSPSSSKQNNSSTSMNSADKPQTNLKQSKQSSSAAKNIQDSIPSEPQPGSMLSLLYSSSVPMPLPPMPGPSTVQQTPPAASQEKYAYSPLTQHRFFESRQPLLYPGVPPATNGGQGPSGLPYQFPPYVPNPTQRHYLGYPQAMLTPPGQHMSTADAQMAMHSAMAQVKPKSRNKSDDEDYDA